MPPMPSLTHNFACGRRIAKILCATVDGGPDAAECAAPQSQLHLRWSNIHRACSDDELTAAVNTLEAADSLGLINTDMGDTQWVVCEVSRSV